MADGGVTGDWARLDAFHGQLRGASDGAFRRALCVELAETAARKIQLGFIAESDPYGTPWPRRQNPGDGHPLLRDTGRLFASLRVRPTGDGIALETHVPYAMAHQYGHFYGARMATNRHDRSGLLTRSGARGRRAPVRINVVRIGAWILPQRQYLPEVDTGGLGPIWEAAFAVASHGVVRAHFGL